MALRRMFSKTITSSSQFLMMPSSSQALYFQLGMNADDDGFCEHFTIMRMTDSKPDDLRILQAKGYVNVFDDKVLVILDWKENNYLRADRYTPSKYKEIYKAELLRLSSGIPTVATGKDSIGEDREGKERLEREPRKREQQPKFQKPEIFEIDEYMQSIGLTDKELPEKFFYYYESKGWVVGKSPMKSWKAAIHTWAKNRNKFFPPGYDTPGFDPQKVSVKLTDSFSQF